MHLGGDDAEEISGSISCYHVAVHRIATSLTQLRTARPSPEPEPDLERIWASVGRYRDMSRRQIARLAERFTDSGPSGLLVTRLVSRRSHEPALPGLGPASLAQPFSDLGRSTASSSVVRATTKRTYTSFWTP